MVCIALDMSHSIGTLSRVWIRDGALKHTFHLMIREKTITLQDVAIILGLGFMDHQSLAHVTLMCRHCVRNF